MAVRQMAEPILQLVQMFDQQVTPPWRIPQQLAHFGDRLFIRLTALGLGFQPELLLDRLQRNAV